MVEEVAVVVRDLGTLGSLALIIHLVRPFVVTARDEIANLTCSWRAPQEGSTTCVELVLFTDILMGCVVISMGFPTPKGND